MLADGRIRIKIQIRIRTNNDGSGRPKMYGSYGSGSTTLVAE
jgi:hypothetical protein